MIVIGIVIVLAALYLAAWAGVAVVALAPGSGWWRLIAIPAYFIMPFAYLPLLVLVGTWLDRVSSL